MTPLELLRQIRRSSLQDDVARVLLAIGEGFQRPADMVTVTELKERRVMEILLALRHRQLVERTVTPSPGGSGKCSIYSATGLGVEAIRAMLSNEGPSIPKRPRPADAPAPLKVRGTGFFFLQS